MPLTSNTTQKPWLNTIVIGSNNSGVLRYCGDGIVIGQIIVPMDTIQHDIPQQNPSVPSVQQDSLGARTHQSIPNSSTIGRIAPPNFPTDPKDSQFWVESRLLIPYLELILMIQPWKFLPFEK